jgi:glycosyltransferase involved in cell wall biosynthesis
VSVPALSRIDWYARRLGRMSAAEIAWRVREQAVRRAWAGRQVRPGRLAALPPLTAVLPARERTFSSPLPADAAARVPGDARAAVIAAADRLVKGEWEMLGIVRTDLERPDWFFDPVTGRRSSPDSYAFSLDQRDESAVGNIKQVWEVNRLQHLTLLATAWYLTGTDAYAERVAEQLTSWWRENPFLSGVNWTAGLELGVRLINFAWIRRLLDGWPPVADLFERNEVALRQIRWHQEYLAAFESKGSSANNHVIAEAAGQLAASCAFPWFPESGRWRRDAQALLERELDHNTFPTGVNRELASDYHGFVAELGFFAAIEAAAAGTPVSGSTWALLAAMTDVMAALVDERVQPPRQGDSDEGRVVLLDAPKHNRWPTLLSLGDALFGRIAWWPPVAPDAASALAGALLGERREVDGRPPRRPDRFADAGITIFRTDPASSPELWLRLDGGPHGFLSIAAHAHSDALSMEARYGGVDILADPGTYCYHGEPKWRKYFQSTIGHNTLEIDGQWQSVRGGPFLWLRHARAREASVADDGTIAIWAAEHDGYARLRPSAVHRRSVRLDRDARTIEITDALLGGDHDVRLAFHLGPAVEAELDGPAASLRWTTAGSAPGAALLMLPGELSWSLHRAETDPILGWYSPGLGHRVPAWTLVGTGRQTTGNRLITLLAFSAHEVLVGGAMKIVLVHSRYRSAAPSGENRVVEQEMEALAALGHEVELFERLSDDIEKWSAARKAALPATVVWNGRARRDLREVLRGRRPDVVHIHNTFPMLSPSVLYACKDVGVPAVATIHNYKLACASGDFFRDGAVCHNCAEGAPTEAIKHGCYRGSRAATAPVALSIMAHRRSWRTLVSAYACVSAAQRDLLHGVGLPADRVFVRYNLIPARPVRRAAKQSVVVYAGRLDKTKGLPLLMAGWDRYLSESDHPGLGLVIVGSGELEGTVRAWAATRPSVRMAGRLDPDACAEEIAAARAIVLPSAWEESFGLAAVEAMSLGVAPVAAAHGSFPEIITDEVDGVLFRPGDPAALAGALRRADENDKTFDEYGARARKTYEQRFNPADSVDGLLAIYRYAIENPV